MNLKRTRQGMREGLKVVERRRGGCDFIIISGKYFLKDYMLATIDLEIIKKHIEYLIQKNNFKSNYGEHFSAPWYCQFAID